MKPNDLPFPMHPVAAAAHHNPYPYYDALAVTQEWYYDPALQLWVAASAAAVDEVLAHADCQAPMPSAPPAINLQAAREQARLIGRRLWRGDRLQQWMTCVPELALASLCGGKQPALPTLTYEAVSGLIGNSILALLNEPEEQRSGSEEVDALVRAVSRLDPPLQNARRMVTRDCVVNGARLQAGQQILLVLAAASRDARNSGGCRQTYGLGCGAPGCAHYQLACALAAGALHGMLTAIQDQRNGPTLQAWLETLVWSYRPSTSMRIPLILQRA